MRAVVQRVSEARVTVAGETVGAIGPGLLVLLGVGADFDEQLRRLGLDPAAVNADAGLG